MATYNASTIGLPHTPAVPATATSNTTVVPNAAPPVTTNRQARSVYVPRWVWPICERCGNKEHRGDCWAQCWQCHRRHRAGQCPPSKEGSQGTAAAPPVPLPPGLFLAQNNFNIFMAPGSSANELAQAIAAAIRRAPLPNRMVGSRGNGRRGRRGRRGGRGQKSQNSAPNAIAAAAAAATTTTTSLDPPAGEQADRGDVRMRDDETTGNRAIP
ncbi:MAG: hypothetical protein Q9210_000670 [Variospora velana]